ncbi:hypothetical protein L2E82_40321 [Cichorium intybus]|uniref:Uncharacterized protein n=1 Tax=Cichorium intybus TaxID=13427 RepID=A0ACB9AME2_CICIN|nr:hypothetical protein L2E82_40321 [Cichorium intybus]
MLLSFRHCRCNTIKPSKTPKPYQSSCPVSIFVSSSPQFTTTATTNVPFHHSQHHPTTPATPILNPFTTTNHRYVPRSRILTSRSQFWDINMDSGPVLKSKIVTTGILFRLFLKKKLSTLQWMAIVLFPIGTTISQDDSDKDDEGGLTIFFDVDSKGIAIFNRMIKKTEKASTSANNSC